MSEREFNLLDEKWIVVMLPSGETEEVSLIDAFRRAPEFKGLAGELATQDVAILRLLLAVLHVVFGRYDLDGKESALSPQIRPDARPADALKRWKALWDKGAFPMELIERYLRKYEDRFWLFHPKTPFYQVAGMKEATEYAASKLNGALSESSNKIRLFPTRAGSNKTTLSWAEAARWLIYINAYDDTSAKPKGKNLPSPGAGWLGKLGLLIAEGNNLFETLLLNLMLLRDGTSLWGKENPVWENPTKVSERTEITMPDNLSQLYTLQSRRLLLKREEDAVVGFLLLGGDFFPKENALSEQMTLWRNASKKKEEVPEYVPRRHDPAKQLWRDFVTLAVQSSSAKRPGVTDWLARLDAEGYFQNELLRLKTVSVKYGDKDFFVDDVFSDTLAFNAGLLSDIDAKDAEMRVRIESELEMTDRLVRQLGWLAQNLAKAQSSSDGDAQRNAARQEGYFRLDIPFRTWLESIDPDEDDPAKVGEAWWEQSQRIIRGIGRELVEAAGPQAFVGRTASENKTERRYTAPEAYNQFLYRTSSRSALMS